MQKAMEDQVGPHTSAADVRREREVERAGQTSVAEDLGAVDSLTPGDLHGGETGARGGVKERVHAGVDVMGVVLRPPRGKDAEAVPDRLFAIRDNRCRDGVITEHGMDVEVEGR